MNVYKDGTIAESTPETTDPNTGEVTPATTTTISVEFGTGYKFDYSTSS